MNIKLNNHTVRTNEERVLTGRPMETISHVHAPLSDRKNGRGGVKNKGIDLFIQLSRLVRRLLKSNRFTIRSVECEAFFSRAAFATRRSNLILSDQVVTTAGINEPNLDSSLRRGSNKPRRLDNNSIFNRTSRRSQFNHLSRGRIALNERRSRGRMTRAVNITDNSPNRLHLRRLSPRRNFPQMLVCTRLAFRHGRGNFDGVHTFLNPISKRSAIGGVAITIGNETQHPVIFPKENTTGHITTLFLAVTSHKFTRHIHLTLVREQRENRTSIDRPGTR